MVIFWKNLKTMRFLASLGMTATLIDNNVAQHVGSCNFNSYFQAAP